MFWRVEDDRGIYRNPIYLKDRMKKSYSVLTLVLLISLIILYSVSRQPDQLLQMVDRISGLFGYLFLFLALLSSEYMKQIKNIFGKGFIKVHHQLGRIAVALMLIHPVAFALEKGSILVFVPIFFPLEQFLELAGRPALYVLLIGILAGVYRKKMIKTWKKFHYLIYPGFLLVFIHAWFIGTDLQYPFMQFLWVLMLLIAAGVFVHKHIRVKKVK